MGLLKKQKFPLLLGPRNRNDMRENNRNDKRNFERRDGKKRDFKGKRDYRDRDRKQEVQQADEEFTGGMVEGRNAVIEAFLRQDRGQAVRPCKQPGRPDPHDHP